MKSIFEATCERTHPTRALPAISAANSSAGDAISAAALRLIPFVSTQLIPHNNGLNKTTPAKIAATTVLYFPFPIKPSLIPTVLLHVRRTHFPQIDIHMQKISAWILLRCRARLPRRAAPTFKCGGKASAFTDKPCPPNPPRPHFHPTQTHQSQSGEQPNSPMFTSPEKPSETTQSSPQTPNP